LKGAWSLLSLKRGEEKYRDDGKKGQRGVMTLQGHTSSVGSQGGGKVGDIQRGRLISCQRTEALKKAQKKKRRRWRRSSAVPPRTPWQWGKEIKLPAREKGRKTVVFRTYLRGKEGEEKHRQARRRRKERVAGHTFCPSRWGAGKEWGKRALASSHKNKGLRPKK